jgi:NodT family efflux transporter outer membrane factor (OMF) lipoprotein
MKRLAILLVGTFALLLEGCTVGPKYTKAPVPMPQPDTYKELDGWKTAKPSDQALKGNWWEIFNDPELNSLEEQVNVSNQDLKIFEARFREARAQVRYNRSFQFPTISIAPSITGERLSQNQPYFPVSTYNTGDYSLPVDLSYEVDVWGRVRRTVSAARKEAQATAGDLESVSLSLHAELALDYFELRSADAQEQLLHDTVKAYSESLQLTVDRFEGGESPKSDVAQAQTQLDAARVQETDITVQRAEYEHAIAVLIGKPPAQFSLPPRPADFQPPDITVGLPSQLLERRPDISAAERRVAEANEQIGIARAAYFPTVLLNAAAGFESQSLADWFTWPSRFWAVGPTIAETIFDAGRRRATSQGAQAGYDATVANYRQTTLTAFQQVEDNLAALRILDREAQQQHEATKSAQDSLEIFTNRYIGGADPYLQVLTAQTIALANERNDVDILRRRMDASVLLIKAVGGGWDSSQLPTSKQVGQLGKDQSSSNTPRGN